MTGELLNSDRLFQALFEEGLTFTAAADLDAATIDDMPTLTHSSSVAQTGNGDDLWEGVLAVHLFVYANNAFAHAAEVYRLIHSWGDHPLNGIVPGVGAVEVVTDMNAISRSTGVIQMDTKQVVQYDGTFSVIIRKL